MSPATLTEIKAHMAYREPGTTCGNCARFAPASSAARHQGQPDHCTLSPAYLLPVEPSASCKWFSPKQAKAG